MQVFINNLKPISDYEIQEIISDGNPFFDKPSNSEYAQVNSISWIKNNSDVSRTIKNTKSSFVVVSNKVNKDFVIPSQQAILFSNDPKLTFARICRKFFVSGLIPSVHETAIVSPEASVHSSTSIGAGCVIGESTIGANCEIRPNVVIGDKVTLGDNVIIDFGAVLGSQGYGYYRNQEKEIESFPQLGGIVVGNDVYIGSNSTIDCGSLSNTVIGNGTKIDNLVHIAHNAIIGNNVLIIANAMIAGSVRIEDNCWIAPSTSVLNQMQIGEGSTVGLGSVVLKSVPSEQTYIGNPARPVKEFIKFQKNK